MLLTDPKLNDLKNKLFKSFYEIYPLSMDDFELSIQHVTFKTYKKGQQILSFGEIEKKTNLILSGVVHRTVKMYDEIFTLDISLSNMYMCNLESFIEESPSLEIQTALTDVEILCIEKEITEKLTFENHAFCYIYYYLRNKTTLKRDKRLNMLQTKNASKRFELFMNTNDNAKRYLKEVPQRIIAEYLNVTPETLSRVKKIYFQKN